MEQETEDKAVDKAEDMAESNELKDKAEDLAEAGRASDTVVAHMTIGEIAIPPDLLAEEEDMAAIKAIFDKYGVDINEFTVGHEANKINPETGQPEFFSFKKIFKAVAPIALSFIPGIGPLAAAGLGAGIGALGGGGLKGALLGGLGSYAGAGGFGNTAIGRGIDSLKSGIADTVVGRGVGDVFKTASGALDNVGGGVDKLYQGSTLQSAFKSGGDALKSVGIDTASTASAPAPSVGGGSSSYGQPNAGATNVATSRDYASPLLSAAFGTYSNDKAAKALLEQQRNNQALLSPYANGFSFNATDLQNDPGYQFNLAEGTKAADRAQLARGGYFSGDAAKELATFNQGLADNTYNSAFNRALQGRSAGLQGALATAGVNTDIGNIKANSATNQGNLYSGALGALLGGKSFTNTGALQGGFDIQEFLRRNGIGSSAYAG